jgi:hypothetical protein
MSWVPTRAQIEIVAGELDALLGLDPVADAATFVDEMTLAVALERRVSTDRRKAILEALVAALAGDRARPFASLVHDLAEILFLPREERSEWRDASTPPGPWVFPKLMLEYAVWNGRLDSISRGLLSPFCASDCPSPPVGCCYLLGYDMGLVPEGMLRLQELEARLGGWSMPDDPDLRKCRYHSSSGCALRLFKTPACLQYVCRPMRAALERDRGVEPARALCHALHELGRQDIDRRRIFAALERVVEAGRACIAGAAAQENCER